MSAQDDLIAAAREVEARVYRDCPSSNPRHVKADRAVQTVLDIVLHAMGLHDAQVSITREGVTIAESNRP